MIYQAVDWSISFFANWGVHKCVYSLLLSPSAYFCEDWSRYWGGFTFFGGGLTCSGLTFYWICRPVRTSELGAGDWLLSFHRMRLWCSSCVAGGTIAGICSPIWWLSVEEGANLVGGRPWNWFLLWVALKRRVLVLECLVRVFCLWGISGWKSYS